MGIDMNHFFVITNEHKDPERKLATFIKDFLTNKGKRCTIGFTGKEIQSLSEEVDAILILGGDGTMLQAARDTIEKNIPLLGVNLGTLGYLAEVEKNGIEGALEQLIHGDFSIEERMMLTGRVEKNKEWLEDTFALNDVVLSREGPLQIIKFGITVNDQYLKGYSADGIIVATPTGSTGYNMSAGGPIVEPRAKILLLTPICPHTLNSRSIVLSPNDEIEIVVGAGKEEQLQKVEVTFDGSEKVDLKTGDKIRIKQSEKVTQIIKLSKVSFLDVLHKKMREG